MSQLVLTHHRRMKRGKLRRSVEAEIGISPYSLLIVLLVFVGVSSLIQLVTSNQASMKGYEIKRLDDRRRELLDINERGHNKLSELSSMVFIKSNIVSNSMVAPSKVTYVRGETAVALNE